VASVDGARAYPGVATLFRRTLIVKDAGNNRRYAIDIFELAGGRTHDYFLHGDADSPSSVNAALPLKPLDTLLPAGFEWRPGRNEGEVGLASQPWWAYGHLHGLRSAPVQANVSVPVTFRTSPDSGLRVTLVPQPGSRLVLGENPAVRGAKEDDGKLDQFSRPFMMLRRQADGEPSAFISVIEPFEGEPFIQSVERVASPAGTVALRVVAAGRTELIRYDPKAPLTPRSVQRATLETIEGSFLVLADAAAHEPTQGDVVRLITADGWVYPFTAASFERTAKSLKIRVTEGPGMSFDPAAKRLKLAVFPQREHSGPVAIEWMAR
jgi:hypothetical protein